MLGKLLAKGPHRKLLVSRPLLAVGLVGLAFLPWSTVAPDTVELRNGRFLRNVRTQLEPDALIVTNQRGVRRRIPLAAVRRIIRQKVSTPARTTRRRPPPAVVRRPPTKGKSGPPQSVPDVLRNPLEKPAPRPTPLDPSKRMLAPIDIPFGVGKAERNTGPDNTKKRSDPPRTGEKRADQQDASSRKPTDPRVAPPPLVQSLIPGWSGLNSDKNMRPVGVALSAMKGLAYLYALAFARPRAYPDFRQHRQFERTLLVVASIQENDAGLRAFSISRLYSLENKVSDPRSRDSFISRTYHRQSLQLFASVLLTLTLSDVLLAHSYAGPDSVPTGPVSLQVFASGDYQSIGGTTNAAQAPRFLVGVRLNF